MCKLQKDQIIHTFHAFIHLGFTLIRREVDSDSVTDMAQATWRQHIDSVTRMGGVAGSRGVRVSPQLYLVTPGSHHCVMPN